ncbi:LacI family transcriptional regulator [Aureimonas endophytica]|uniref:LacI family transcriptional regulator n=1 Tax=Aureimonas endophytica TaxID=2027858 RepID=A0A917E8F8_9HYPH|nr:ABC transporter substrate-binding protein [Aureimonas endophytica]GGE10988.1 LacI family transcriptional regulator [Aureimonas endophytica]
MKIIKTIVAAAAIAAAMSGAQAQDADMQVGVTVGTLGNPFFVPLVAGAKDAILKAYPKANLTVLGADYDLNKQTSQMENFIASGAKLIMLNAVDVNAIAPVVARAKAAGITIGAFDVAAKGADVTVMTNNVQAGQIACDYLAERLNGKGEVVIINGPPVSSIVDRVKGCKDAFAKHKDIKILSDDQDGKASREGGLAVMQSLLTRFPKIDAVFGANDPTAIGADLAARQLGRSEMIIAGVDGAPDVVTALKSGSTRIVASSSQDPYGMAEKAAQLALGVIKGEKPAETTVLLDTKLVTADNVKDYVGWDAKR